MSYQLREPVPRGQPRWLRLLAAEARRYRVDVVIIALTLLFVILAAGAGLILVRRG